MYLFKHTTGNHIRVAISNRLLCPVPLEKQIGLIARRTDFFILREKDLPDTEYRQLACKVQTACKQCRLPLAINSRIGIARELGITNLHLPFSLFQDCSHTLQDFSMVGVSVHSAEEALYASRCGADYIIAGHIFATDCKRDLAPRGLDYLKNICESADIPVFAIGGIRDENVQSVLDAGAAGECRMSGYMK